MNLEDTFAIQEAIASYSYTWDSADPDGWADVFADNGIMEFRRKGEVEPRTQLVGRAALREFAADRFRELGDTQPRHYQTGTVFVEQEAETAHTRTMVLVTWLLAGETTAIVRWTGIYDDDWSKTETGWKISKRVCVLDQSA